MGTVVADGESTLFTQSYYDGFSVASASPAVTNNNGNSNLSVKLHQNFTYINDTSTIKEYIGVDNESVFQYMYIISISGYVVNATLFFTICCRQKFRRYIHSLSLIQNTNFFLHTCLSCFP